MAEACAAEVTFGNQRLQLSALVEPQRPLRNGDLVTARRRQRGRARHRQKVFERPELALHASGDHEHHLPAVGIAGGLAWPKARPNVLRIDVRFCCPTVLLWLVDNAASGLLPQTKREQRVPGDDCDVLLAAN